MPSNVDVPRPISSNKINELGVGKRVVQQLGDTALGAVENIVSPLTEWLEKYEKILPIFSIGRNFSGTVS